MPRRLDEIARDFDALTAGDFDCANIDASAWDHLHRLCDELREIGDVPAAAAIMFRTMERLDDVELGSPVPLVHTLENWRGEYERFLAESVRRKPSPLSVWMINRILNVNPPDSETWVDLLRKACSHHQASEETRAQAKHFLVRQEERARA